MSAFRTQPPLPDELADQENKKSTSPPDKTTAQKIDQAGDLAFNAGFMMTVGGFLFGSALAMTGGALLMAVGVCLSVCSFIVSLFKADEEMAHSKRARLAAESQENEQVGQEMTQMSPTAMSPSHTLVNSRVGRSGKAEVGEASDLQQSQGPGMRRSTIK